MKEAFAEVISPSETELPNDDPTLTDRSVSECWALYLDRSKSHTELTENEIYTMMQSLIDVRDRLKVIEDDYYRIVIDNLSNRYFDLLAIAMGRKLDHYPRWRDYNAQG